MLIFCSVTRLELVPWLLQQISEQKRVDLSTSGARMFTDITQNNVSSKDVATSSDVQMVLPGDAKKMKSLKNMYIDRGMFTSPIHLKVIISSSFSLRNRCTDQEFLPKRNAHAWCGCHIICVRLHDQKLYVDIR